LISASEVITSENIGSATSFTDAAPTKFSEAA
jgi:hypothetical protein